MQNKYVGDIGDFGKYELLRYLAKAQLPLGVNWYLTPDEEYCGDGRLTAYLNSGLMEDYDSDLFTRLYCLVKKERRNVREVETSDILSADTAYYSRPLDWVQVTPENTRTAYRAAWHQSALTAMKNSKLVFLDPDNGLQVKSVSPTSSKGNKYIAFEELKDYTQLGKSVVFYNHRERLQENLYLDKFRKLRLDEAYQNLEWFGLKFSGGTVRDYIFLLQPDHAQAIISQCQALLGSKWRSHFSQLAL